jgi:hypothetical protein
MHLGGQRQHPRVQLDTPIRLRRSDEGPWLNARVFDLSEGGVGLHVHEGMPVGSEVRCSLPLLGARGSDLELKGTVAWIEGAGDRQDTKTLVRLGAERESEPTTPRRSMGLQFADVTPDDAIRIRNAVRAAAARPCEVVLSLEGRAEPITARAEPTPEGLLLRAALPIVRIGAAVGVRFGGDGDGDSVVGVVKNITLGASEGAPELRIEVVGRESAAGLTGEESAAASGNGAHPVSPNALLTERLEDQTVRTRVRTETARALRPGASLGFVAAVTVLSVAVGVLIGVELGERWPHADTLPVAAGPARSLPHAAPSAPATLAGTQPPRVARVDDRVPEA